MRKVLLVYGTDGIGRWGRVQGSGDDTGVLVFYFCSGVIALYVFWWHRKEVSEQGAERTQLPPRVRFACAGKNSSQPFFMLVRYHCVVSRIPFPSCFPRLVRRRGHSRGHAVADLASCRTWQRTPPVYVPFSCNVPMLVPYFLQDAQGATGIPFYGYWSILFALLWQLTRNTTSIPFSA